jgi:peptide/nickel transport system permease protein
MSSFVLRRLPALIPTFVVGTMIVFLTIRLIPGDVVDVMMSQKDIGASAKTEEQLVEALGLNQPVYVQYIKWVFGIVLHFDLGNSLWTSEKLPR